VPAVVLARRYELGPAIGSGGFGTVFRAKDLKTNTEVAVKLVRPGLGSDAAAYRLRREGAMLRRVASRYVAKVYDMGEDPNDGVWLVTELVADAGPLAIATLGRALLPHEVLRVARGLLEGLAAVHAATVVHGDVKPSNVLVPRGEKALDYPKLVDFGLARVVSRSEVAASIGDAMTREGSVLGTARYMAPEVLSGGEVTSRADLYAAGLVLFELLDVGPLFPVGDGRAQLRARVSNEPVLTDRVPEPLSDVFARMLSRDPAARYQHAGIAHEAVVDLDTAPVSVVGDSLPPSARVSVPVAAQVPAPPGSIVGPGVIPPLHIPNIGMPPSSRRATTTSSSPPPQSSFPPSSSPPSSGHSTAPPSGGYGQQQQQPQQGIPSSMRPASESRRRSPSSPPIARLTSLPTNGVVALRETLRHLDLPMLDALARRERGNPIGRISRAVALALRLELDAAALILEPLAMQSDVARAIGATVLAPRARRVTRARVDSDREDKWVETIDPELGAMLVALATALATTDDAPRDVDRCARALVRLDTIPATQATPFVDATRITLRIAQVAARVRRGELDRGVARDLVTPLGHDDARAPFDFVIRALSAGALSPALADDLPDNRMSADLERAERIAAETGTTLLDASAATALGTLLATLSPRDEKGLLALERAGTLLAHGDAPSLEHEAEQHRATVLIALGRWADAIVHLRAAREAAHAERAGELEILSTALETLAELAVGDAKAAQESVAILGDARLGAIKNARTAAIAWVARALASLSQDESAGRDNAAEDALTEAEARVREADRTLADIYILVEILGMLFDAARGALPDMSGPAATLEKFAEDHGFEAFYWFDLLGAIVKNLPPSHKKESETMSGVLERLAPFLGPGSRLARERRTDAPPGASSL
jgi:eukaryotic-like serine/threonine-protein kinase